MRLFRVISFLLFAFLLAACAEEEPKTPRETLEAYSKALKKKNVGEMRSLLSKGSIEMAQKEAKAQNLSVDEIIKRETLFSEDQRVAEIRNQKIEGDTATIEIKNQYGTWDIVPFVKEGGKWKIAKERYAEELMKQAEEDNKRLEEQINQGRQP
jgi:PBP1b-binding outer membrane lipoprotein LpoB